MKRDDPYVIIGLPPCTMMSLLQELAIHNNQHKPGWMENFKAERGKAKQHVTFGCS